MQKDQSNHLLKNAPVIKAYTIQSQQKENLKYK